MPALGVTGGRTIETPSQPADSLRDVGLCPAQHSTDVVVSGVTYEPGDTFNALPGPGETVVVAP